MAEAWRVLKPNGSVIINIRPNIKNGQISDYTLRTRLALREAGWNECEELIWQKTNPMPMGSVERPRRAWESLHWFAKHGRPYANAKANGRPPVKETGVHKYGQHVRAGWDHVHSGAGTTPAVARSTDIAHLSTNRASSGHPAQYPPELAEWCGKLTCPQDGTILDPFSGSGSTGVAAIRNGWNYIGIEAVAEYVDMSRVRLASEQARIN